jgi:inosose dehydratase
MSIDLRLASAPCTWGVWERTVDRDDLVPPRRMLGTVAELGYTGIELGPPGYFGTTPDAVSALLGEHGLALVGAFAPIRIASEQGFAEDLPFLDETIEILAATGAAGPVVLAADENEIRLAVAGRPEARAATSLQGDDLKWAAERVQFAAERARSRGVRVAFHPHTATYVEGPEEVAALLELTDVGICFDTGHCVVGGGDPVEFVRATGRRITHLHLKDVDQDILDRVRSQELTVEEAWEQGLFCPFGEGSVDFGAVLSAPELSGLDGWVVLEQDRVAVRQDDLAEVRRVEERNLAVVAAASGA